MSVGFEYDFKYNIYSEVWCFLSSSGDVNRMGFYLFIDGSCTSGISPAYKTVVFLEKFIDWMTITRCILIHRFYRFSILEYVDTFRIVSILCWCICTGQYL